MSSDGGDMEKLHKAFSELTQMFGSVDNVLETFGLAHMPTAQRYGLVFGCFVFVFTVTAVVSLLVMGGSFKRMAEQADTGEATIQEGYKARMGRALLLERLLEARERLLESNYPDRKKPQEKQSNLTKMLLNVSPTDKDKSTESIYKKNFAVAYRTCQDKPGGASISGRPEARFEAYARAYAGCGDHASRSHCRSYARIYETLACDSHKSDDTFLKIFKETPEAIVGKTIRLEGLETKMHAKELFDATNGQVYHDMKSYDAQKVWGFQEDGPFKSADDMAKSYLFRRLDNESAFCIRQNLTDRVIGVIMLKKDEPRHLSIQLEIPVLNPALQNSKAQLEACYLLMDRLFAHGYRRIQIAIDAKDTDGSKLADRLGFTYEGCLLKEMIVKESSRDSNIFGMLNSDWDKGARLGMYKKLYGLAAARADHANNKKEEELDEQKVWLAGEKAAEQNDKSKKE